MNIRTETLGDGARDAYRQRYLRRGRATRRRVRRSDIGRPVLLDVDGHLIEIPAMGVTGRQLLTGRVYDHAHGSAPNHAARTARLPFFSLGPPRRPAQKPCPSTPPKSTTDRYATYRAQNGSPRLTPRQARRLNHKTSRMENNR